MYEYGSTSFCLDDIVLYDTPCEEKDPNVHEKFISHRDNVPGVFTQYDTTHSGKLKREDFKKFIYDVLTTKVSGFHVVSPYADFNFDQHAKLIFELYDEDKDGLLSEVELSHYLNDSVEDPIGQLRVKWNTIRIFPESNFSGTEQFTKKDSFLVIDVSRSSLRFRFHRDVQLESVELTPASPYMPNPTTVDLQATVKINGKLFHVAGSLMGTADSEVGLHASLDWTSKEDVLGMGKSGWFLIDSQTVEELQKYSSNIHLGKKIPWCEK
eukprot:TRINITY_DN2736_c0_g1_i3.p1 TRINITY_DN2736_c0_g1~~TRINITY_DN2736_c0_g1_i3.p1  ORF type:complete len:268 (-),score=30.62 TRINITY_DN2736_c0_g1_i3:100-903(-)